MLLIIGKFFNYVYVILISVICRLYVFSFRFEVNRFLRSCRFHPMRFPLYDSMLDWV